MKREHLKTFDKFIVENAVDIYNKNICPGSGWAWNRDKKEWEKFIDDADENEFPANWPEEHKDKNKRPGPDWIWNTKYQNWEKVDGEEWE